MDMDWGSLSRLIPEVAILIVVGYFALKGVSIFREIVDKIDSEHHNALKKLSKSIDLNTKATKSADEYLRERNGRDNEMHSLNIKAMQNLNKNFAIMSEDMKGANKRLVDYIDQINARVGKQTIDQQTVKHQTVEEKE